MSEFPSVGDGGFSDNICKGKQYFLPHKFLYQFFSKNTNNYYLFGIIYVFLSAFLVNLDIGTIKNAKLDIIPVTGWGYVNTPAMMTRY